MGLNITKNITTISIIVGISLYILKNLDVFLLFSKAKSLRYLPNEKWYKVRIVINAIFICIQISKKTENPMLCIRRTPNNHERIIAGIIM